MLHHAVDGDQGSPLDVRLRDEHPVERVTMKQRQRRQPPAMGHSEGSPAKPSLPKPVVDLPVMPPIRPMPAKSVKGIPDPAKHGGLSFEPKWDVRR